MEIGRKLGVDALVLGSLAQRGSSLAITAEMVRVGDAAHLWGEKYTRRADDVLQVEGEIAATIARTLMRQLSGEDKARLARAATADPEAYRLYLKGRDFLRGSQQEMDRSIELLQQAVAKAPDYALAHAGLASQLRARPAWAGGTSSSHWPSRESCQAFIAAIPVMPSGGTKLGPV